MRLLFSLILAVTFYTSPAPADFEGPSEWEPTYAVDLVQFTQASTGELYTAILIGAGTLLNRQAKRPGGDWDIVDSDYFAQRVMRWTQEWIAIQQQLAYGEDHSPEEKAEWQAFFKRMHSLDSPADNRSSMVVIIKGTDVRLSTIVSSFRVVHPYKGYFYDPNGKEIEDPNFPSETLFGIRFPRPKLTARKEPYRFLDLGGGVGEYQAYTAGILELKNLVRRGDIKEDLVRMMAVLAEAWGMTNQVYYALDERPFWKWPWRDWGRWHAHAKEYMLTCHERMIPYYERIGFSVVPGVGTENAVVMKITREKWIEKLQSWLEISPGARALLGEKDRYIMDFAATERWKKITFTPEPIEVLKQCMQAVGGGR